MMQEDFLHYLWKFKKIDVLNLQTTDFEKVEIVSVGEHNTNSGPDFFNSQIRIDDQLWAGNVEIHVKASDWFLHNHERDSRYDNVILHVVWDYDTDIFRKDNSKLPTLVLKDFVSDKALSNYQDLMQNSKLWINCERDLNSVDDFVINNWLERLYFERLERKSEVIEELLFNSKNDWEAVLFKMLAKNFGLKVNGDAFFSIANSLDYSIVRKLQSKPVQLEALLFGQASLLDEALEVAHFIELQSAYKFLKQKYSLGNQGVIPLQFFRLRPANFPTIRLSQLAQLYNTHSNLFSKLMDSSSINEIYKILRVSTSDFWETHYTFSKTSKATRKKTTKSFIDLLLINTIIPLKYCYAKHHGKQIDDEIINLIQKIGAEKNSIISKFQSIKPIAHSALQSQALIQLKNEYCDKNKCLRCAIGNSLLSKN